MTTTPLYLDPSTGSIAYQVAISSVLAAVAAGRLYWEQLKRLLTGRPRLHDDCPAEDRPHDPNGG